MDAVLAMAVVRTGLLDDLSEDEDEVAVAVVIGLALSEFDSMVLSDFKVVRVLFVVSVLFAVEVESLQSIMMGISLAGMK